MSYVQELLTDEDVFPTKAGKRRDICAAWFWNPTPVPLSNLYSFPLFQVRCFRQALSFSSRRCFCCFSGLWLTFTGLTTERPSRWACTHTLIHYSHIWYSSASSTRCWSRRRLSRCRTSSQLWDSKAEPKEQTHILYAHIYTLLYSFNIWL